MIFFGHLGLTLTAFKMYEKLNISKEDKINNFNIDYRFVLIGSILPDMVDKPIGAYFFRQIFHNSRIFSHTLSFSMMLLVIAIWLLKKKGNLNVLILSISVIIHQILDSMWLYPGILFWPFLGWKFPRRPEGDWVQEGILRLIQDPTYFIPEMIGFIVVFYYFVKLMKNKQMLKFIKSGKM